MFIGVIVSCMPATWNFLPHNHKFLALKSSLSFKSPRLWSNYKTSSKNQSTKDSPAKSLSERVDSLHRKECNDSKIEASSSLKEYQKEESFPQMKLEFSPFGSVETYIRSD
ncbi:457bd074-c1d4-4dc6-a97f-2ad9b9f933dc-CDS [Sclerotinia trifoliorum]|uniref:457bd074-c1d4-4dc6-a97f-2ad9b9f933dc-CDS n=1 Tax=Sclerotinia trifoliorum TaxID=28548 RepID=A0A8H2VV29_9HELO|nr:457bd074-c1d4-4dc6-a97f-2ad9b9f933dc-CDS [Sclerotinia trifoliorum]